MVDKLRELTERPELAGSIRVAVARPGLVTEPDSLRSGMPGSILGSTLAAGMVSTAISGLPRDQNFVFYENSDLANLGRTVLTQRIV